MNAEKRGVSHGRHHRIMAVLAATLLGAGISAAQADDDVNLITSTGYVSLGTFLNNSDFQIKLNGNTAEGSNVDWKSEFGDKDVTRFRLDGLWRINDRHHVRFMYTDYARKATHTIDHEIEWQDDLFPISADVTAKQSFTIIEAAYEYAFMHSENFELTGTAGLHYTTLSASLKATVDDGTGGGGTVEIGGPASVDMPLPVIGARAMWRFGGNFYFDAQAQYFAVSIDEVDGSIINYRAAFTWQPKKYIGVGIGYDSFNIDVDVNKPRFDGSMDWTYSGPQAFFNVSF